MLSHSTGSENYVSDVIGFLLNFIATILGVIIAFEISLRHEKDKDRSEETETKRRTITAIRNELSLNLDDVKNLGAVKTLLFLRTSAYETAVSSGNMSLLDAKLQTDLSNTYLHGHRVEAMSEKLRAMAGMSTTLTDYARTKEDFERRFEDGANSARIEMGETMKKLDEALGSLKESKGV